MSGEELARAGYNIQLAYTPYISAEELQEATESCQQFYIRNFFVTQCALQVTHREQCSASEPHHNLRYREKNVYGQNVYGTNRLRDKMSNETKRPQSKRSNKTKRLWDKRSNETKRLRDKRSNGTNV